MRKNWTASRFEINDLSLIGLFFKKQFNGVGRYGSMGFFDWKILKNYTKQGFVNLVKDGDRIASTTSITPKTVRLNNQDYIVAEIGDTFTDPNYQRQGMFSLLINRSREDAQKIGLDFIYGTPNAASLPGYEKKANFKVMENVQIALHQTRLDITKPLSQRAPWFLAKLASVFHQLLKSLVLRAKSGLSEAVVEEVDELPNDWDDFWNELRDQHGYIMHRSRSALEWRFFTNPNIYHFLVVRLKGKIIGYLTYRVISGTDSRNLSIGDFAFLKGHEKAIHNALNSVYKTAFVLNIELVNSWSVAESPYHTEFIRTGLSQVSEIPLICYQSEFAERFKKCDSWHFTMSDTDNF